MWGLITGSMAGLLDAILILVAYILYPIVIVIFGFFYIFYGSVLYIFGPIVIALMPLGATNRIAKAYVENVFIWNAWPILSGTVRSVSFSLIGEDRTFSKGSTDVNRQKIALFYVSGRGQPSAGCRDGRQLRRPSVVHLEVRPYRSGL